MSARDRFDRWYLMLSIEDPELARYISHLLRLACLSGIVGGALTGASVALLMVALAR